MHFLRASMSVARQLRGAPNPVVDDGDRAPDPRLFESHAAAYVAELALILIESWIMQRACFATLSSALLIARVASAQVATTDPIDAGTPVETTTGPIDAGTPVETTTDPSAPLAPVIVEAESATDGAQFQRLSADGVSYVSVSPSTATPAAPGSADRVLTYSVQLPVAGSYDLYARLRVGPGGASDDSLFYGSGFGIQDPANADDWVTVNGLSAVGFTNSSDVVTGGIGLPLGAGFRWVNLSLFNGGEAPLVFEVSDASQPLLLQIGAREDGLDIDKFALVESNVYETVAELDAGLPGSTVPPPEPRACVPTGPALAATQTKFLGSVYSAAQLPNFTAYFNQVTPENAGKWGSVEATRDVMVWTDVDAAYALARQNGFPFKFHNLIWGQQQPAWIETLPPDEQLQEIEQWFAAVGERYPDADLVDVVNEPLHTPPNRVGAGNYIEALGGAGASGWDWVLNAFRMARAYLPHSKLLLNEYSVVNTPTDLARYEQLIALLQAENLIDAIGEQGHAFSTRGSVDVMRASLDSLAATGLPIMITELDIDGPTDEIQLTDYQRIFPMFWEHPAVAGITLWGYRPGHWRTAEGAYLALDNGFERPALVWLRDYLGSPARSLLLPGQSFSVPAAALAGDSVGQLEAVGSDATNWLIAGGSGADRFVVTPGTGELRVAPGAHFDAATEPVLSLDVFARGECSPTTVSVAVTSIDSAPVQEP
jgi:GH35 family endo-1,4-beta-xylanase